MDEINKYVILVIVAWRLAHLITTENGPFDLIFKLRRWLGTSFFGKLMDCFYCSSIWIGLSLTFLAAANLKEAVLLCLYYSGASIIIEKITNKNFN